MKFRVLPLCTTVLAVFATFGCSDEAEFSLEEMCEISGGNWESEKCKCPDTAEACGEGIFCVLDPNDSQKQNLVCADKVVKPKELCETSKGTWLEDVKKCQCGSETCLDRVYCVSDNVNGGTFVCNKQNNVEAPDQQ